MMIMILRYVARLMYLCTGGDICGHLSMYLVSWDTKYWRIDIYTGGDICGHLSIYLVSQDTSIGGLTYTVYWWVYMWTSQYVLGILGY